jgi:hypothetical protein
LKEKIQPTSDASLPASVLWRREGKVGHARTALNIYYCANRSLGTVTWYTDTARDKIHTTRHCRAQDQTLPCRADNHTLLQRILPGKRQDPERNKKGTEKGRHGTHSPAPRAGPELTIRCTTGPTEKTGVG